MHLSGPPTVQQAIASRDDIWADAALRQPGGPSYEYFEKLLPPLRYVDADFRNYPIVLSAPGSETKARLVSDGSQINALARQPNWRNETGIPVSVFVGADRELFGKDPAALDGPKLADGFLPIVHLSYRHGSGRYGEELFAAVKPKLASQGAIFARFDFPAAHQGRIELRFADGYDFMPGDKGSVVRQVDGKVIAAFDANWEWNKYRSCLTSRPTHAGSAAVIIFTKPAPPDQLDELGATFESRATQPDSVSTHPTPAATGEPPAGPPGELVAPNFTDGLSIPFDLPAFQKHRQVCEQTWRDLINSGTQIDVPEPYVNNAWRGLLVGSYEILVGDHLNYSASNQYARQYVAESGDAVRSLMLFGHEKDVRPMLAPILQYRRANMTYHNAGMKLQLLAAYYWVTRDADYVRQNKSIWWNEVQTILNGREASNQLLPKEKYCGDIDDLVISLNSDANCWRGLRDIAEVMQEIGDTDGESLKTQAASWRKVILNAIYDAENRSINPPFLPVYPGEEIHDPITATRLGSYWNLMSGYMLGSGVFTCDSKLATGLTGYLQKHGGLCMGMLRVQSARSFWPQDVPQNIDDLYGLRYALTLLERDEPDRALVSFYGKLAQGMTRDTFEDGEATSIFPADRNGRYVYLPPNSTANGSFLQQLRYLLVQDWDLDDDGKPDTLRLCFATPRRWLADGKTISVQRAPTAFGEVSFKIESHITHNQVFAEVQLPHRSAASSPLHAMLRLRLPDGKKIASVTVNNKPTKMIDPETIDLSGLNGEVRVKATLDREFL